MNESNRKAAVVGLAGGISAAACVGLLMGQAGSQPGGPKSEYFVTGDSSRAALWQREGTMLRFISQAESTAPERMPRDPMRPMDRPADPNRPGTPKPGEPKPGEPK